MRWPPCGHPKILAQTTLLSFSQDLKSNLSTEIEQMGFCEGAAVFKGDGGHMGKINDAIGLKSTTLQYIKRPGLWLIYRG